MKNIQVPATVKSVNNTIQEALVELSTGTTMVVEFNRERFERVVGDMTLDLVVPGAEVVVEIDLSEIEIALPTFGTIVFVDTTYHSDEWFEERQNP